ASKNCVITRAVRRTLKHVQFSTAARSRSFFIECIYTPIQILSIGSVCHPDSGYRGDGWRVSRQRMPYSEGNRTGANACLGSKLLLACGVWPANCLARVVNYECNASYQDGVFHGRAPLPGFDGRV